MIVFIMFITGIFSAFSLQREELPTIDLELIRITTEYRGASPKDVEINVTNKLEKELLLLENIKQLTSYSLENQSIIIIELDPDAPGLNKTKQNIKDAVNRVTDLPGSVSQKPLIEEIQTVYPMYEIALTGTDDEELLRTYARDLESILKNINGIAKIQKIGYRKKIIAIDAAIPAMKDQMVSFRDIIQAVHDRNIHLSGGNIQSYVSEKKIVTFSQFENLLDVKDVIIRSNYEGYTVKLSDIADVNRSYHDYTVMYRGNSTPAIGFLITKQQHADCITLSEQIQSVLATFQTNLPDSIRVVTIYDFSQLTRTMLDIVTGNALIGFILVLIVMFLFLDTHSALWSAFGIPFSVLGAMVLFPLFGINLNTVTLGALILIIGIIVDDAIVITEHICLLKQSGMNPLDAALYGTQAMIKPVTAAIITTIMAFIPILFIPGILGRFMHGLPVVITILLLFSLGEALFFIPVHVSHAIPPQTETFRTHWFAPLKIRYKKLILNILKKRGRVLSGFIFILLAFFIISLFNIRFLLEQDIDPDHYIIKIEAPLGTPLSITEQITRDIEYAIQTTIPQNMIHSFSSRVGSDKKISDYISNSRDNSNLAIITLYLMPASQRPIASEKIIEKLKPEIEIIKKKRKVNKITIETLGFSAGKAVELTYISNNDQVRNKISNQTMIFLQSLSGVKDIETTDIKGKKEYQVQLNHTRLAQAGVTAQTVAETIRTAFDGTTITTNQEGEEEIDYKLFVKNRKQYSKKDILDLPVSNNAGRLIPLHFFAKLREKEGSLTINHFNGKRSTTISANIDDNITTPGHIISKVQKKFKTKIDATPGLDMNIGGQQSEAETSLQGFYFALIVAVIIIYCILVVLFDSYLQPVIIMSIIPFAIISVFITLLIHGKPLVMITLVGMLGLIGIVVNDTIVMISNLNSKCRKKGVNLETIAMGATERLRPVLLTTLTTFAGLLPTAYGVGGDLPMIRPMVLTMAWGLLFSTLVTLILIPILFSYIKLRNQ